MPGSGGNSLVPLLMNWLTVTTFSSCFFPSHCPYLFYFLLSFFFPPGSSLCTVPPFFLHVLSWWCPWPSLHCLSCVVALPMPAAPRFLHGWASLLLTTGSAEGRGCLEGSLEPVAPAPLPLQLMWVAVRFACVVLSTEEKCSQKSELFKWFRCWRSIWLLKSVLSGLGNSD